MAVVTGGDASAPKAGRTSGSAPTSTSTRTKRLNMMSTPHTPRFPGVRGSRERRGGLGAFELLLADSGIGPRFTNSARLQRGLMQHGVFAAGILLGSCRNGRGT